MRAGVAVPIAVDGALVGALAALGPSADAALMRTAGEVARFVSTQLALAELDASRTRTVQAQLNFLRAQISPHFIYNALTAIESYVRSDPERARDLLVGFAEFIRWTFREHSQYATLAEELRFVDTYLELERARFGDRLAVSLRVAPEVLPVRVPSLVLQPLVENAVRHGLERVNGTARLQISAEDGGPRGDRHGRGRRRRRGSRAARRRARPGGGAVIRSDSATWTSDFALPSETTTG